MTRWLLAAFAALFVTLSGAAMWAVLDTLDP